MSASDTRSSFLEGTSMGGSSLMEAGMEWSDTCSMRLVTPGLSSRFRPKYSGNAMLMLESLYRDNANDHLPCRQQTWPSPLSQSTKRGKGSSTSPNHSWPREYPSWLRSLRSRFSHDSSYSVNSDSPGVLHLLLHASSRKLRVGTDDVLLRWGTFHDVLTTGNSC